MNLKKALRKDAVVMAQVLVTSDNSFFKSLSQDNTKEFFKNSYEFLCNRYGKENIVSSIVHMDERTPHMHFNFVPITIDNRLSAKSILTRQNLIEQQTSFYEKVGKKYGLERGIQGGIKKHIETNEYKLNTMILESEKIARKREQTIEEIKVLE